MPDNGRYLDSAHFLSINHDDIFVNLDVAVSRCKMPQIQGTQWWNPFGANLYLFATTPILAQKNVIFARFCPNLPNCRSQMGLGDPYTFVSPFL